MQNPVYKNSNLSFSIGNDLSLNSWYNIKLYLQNMERNHAVQNVKELHKFYAKMNKKKTIQTENRILSQKTSLFSDLLTNVTNM